MNGSGTTTVTSPAHRRESGTASSQRWLTRKRLFTLHGWLGLNFGLLLTLVCLSGAIATLTHEIEWLTQPNLRIQPTGAVRWQATYEALQRYYPEYTIGGFSRGEVSVMEGLAWISYVTAPDGRWGQVRVNPYTAEVVRPATQLYLADFVRQLHYNFHGVWGLGFYIVCFVSFPLLLSIITGLLFYKGWWKHLVRLRTGKGTHAFWSSVHRLLGVWTAIFGFIIAITGIWYLVENDLVPKEIAYPSAPDVPPEKLSEHGPTPTMRSLEELIAAAQAAFPELEPNGVYLPGRPGQTVIVQGQAGGLLMRDRANAVFLDPFDASVVAVSKSAENGVLSWWVNAADALHFGYWGGLATKLLWALLGLCLPISVLSGAYLSLRRAGLVGGASHRSKAARALPWWRRYPLRTYVLLPMLLLLTWSCVNGYQQRSLTLQIAPKVEVGKTKLGPWRAEVWRDLVPETDASSGKTRIYRVRIYVGEDRVANFRSARVRTTLPASDSVLEAELRGAPPIMTALLPLSARTGESLQVTIEAEDWNGTQYRATLLDETGDTSTKVEASLARRNPPGAPAVFWGILWLYAATCLLVGGIWFILDRRTP